MENLEKEMVVKSQPKQKQEANANQQSYADALAEAIGIAIAKNMNNAASVQNGQDITNASVAAIEINRKVQEKARNQINFQRKIADDLNNKRNCRLYSIPLIYKEYQPSITVSINGCTIKVPADGVPRLIHNRYIDIIEQRLRHLDQKINDMNNSGRDIREMPR